MKELNLSIVLPAFNSKEFIGDTLNSILSFFDDNNLNGEVVVVDDGSRDGMVVLENDRVQLVGFDRNQGKGAALRAGVKAAKGEYIITTDADLPYGTEPFQKSLFYLKEKGFHAVVGDRNLPGSTYTHVGFFRRAISSIARLFFGTLVTGGFFDTQCGFKGFRKDIAKEIFSLSRVKRFAIDVEVIYLLLKYRLDIKRISVNLVVQHPSTVRVFRDSARGLLDTFQIKLNSIRGHYQSNFLKEVLISENDELSNK